MTFLMRDDRGATMQALNPDLANMQNVTISGTSAQTAAITNSQKNASRAWVISTTACWVKYGSGSQTAVADATSMYVPANTYVYIPVSDGVTRVAFIQNAAGGTGQVVPGL